MAATTTPSLADRAPDWVASGTPEPLRSQLVAAVGEPQLLGRATDLIRYASDASAYRLIPRAVVAPRHVADVVALLAVARRTRTPLVFRSGGTSLNGQSQSESVLVDVRRHWRGLELLDDGAHRVRIRPGMTLGHVNRTLAPHGRRLGPDPASTDIATVGGVIANNAGGMRCGTTADSYSTVRAMTLVLAGGAVVDTRAPDAEARFARVAPELAAGLLEIRSEILADGPLAERIRRKFTIKNTTGYRLCAFLDADTPLEIFRRLVVGSEGTLAFVADAEFATVALGRRSALALVHFSDLDRATAAVPELVAAGATATELMVAPTLIAAAWNMPGTPEQWRELPPTSAAVLVEFRADDDERLAPLVDEALDVLAEHATMAPAAFTRDPHEIEMLWRVREGMQGLLAAMRAPGASLLIEDVCVPPARIAEAARDLQALLGEHGFLQGLAGHASAGNLHFLLTVNFGDAADLERYDRFMHALADLIVDTYDGSLKAEHGTGVNMAPFVEREWGPAATDLMWRVKALADPDGILGPGIVLNRDPGIHLRNLKSAPEIEPGATKCIECGFCEPACPSRNLTTTPRQRIVLRREIARQPARAPVRAALEREFVYDGLETCAADGMCASACPVAIDTGALVKELRAGSRSASAARVAAGLAERWDRVEAAARAGLRAGRLAGTPAMRALTGLARTALDHELIPAWPAAMPGPAAARLPATAPAGAAAIYLPSCLGRIFGPPDGRPPLPRALVAVSARAGLPVHIPADVPGHCCAVPWSSKGYAAGARVMATRTADALWRWTEQGRLPVVIDASSCTQGIKELGARLDEERAARHAQLTVLDSIEWVADRLLPRLEPNRRVRRATVHPNCSAQHLGLAERLRDVVGELAEEVVVPPGTTCCGMAGDRGLHHPELTASALEDVCAELAGERFDAALSCNRTCEIALAEQTGRPYESFVVLLDELTRT